MKKSIELNDLVLNSEAAVKKGCLYISGENAVVRQKELYNVADLLDIDVNKKLYFECKIDTLNGAYFNVYCDYGFICYSLNMGFGKWATVEEVGHRLNIPADQLEYEYMKEAVLQNAKNGYFVNIGEIKLLSLGEAGKDVIEMLLNCRKQFIENRRKKDEAEQLEKIARAKEKYNTLLNDFDNELAAAEKMILDKKQVINKEIDFPILDGSYAYTEDRNLTLELFKKHNIKVPLRTQGWINKALYSLKWSDESNRYIYDYYTSSRNSTVFMEYLEKLVNAIKKENGVTVYEEEAINFDFTGFSN